MCVANYCGPTDMAAPLMQGDAALKDDPAVAARLVRWALVKDYGLKFAYRSPEFSKLEINGDKAAVTFGLFGSSALRPFDVLDAVGFAVCGEDKAWHWAK